ncbi:MAG: 16S rRNA (uracil(1498)-N(3))-methyltransferase, partial [Cytophagales bacterium]|nr:16S rRNA (uracil(1498)-N(3))-methyltransferase [Cytophagales bacterium]
FNARLIQVHKKKCVFEIISETISEPKPFYIHLAIAPTKSVDRIEWMVEKLCEIGVDKITFLQTNHSERKKLQIGRLEKKTISALKQSKNPFKTQVNELQSFKNFISEIKIENRFIAHVDFSHPYLGALVVPKSDLLILVGPEGDFSNEEMEAAIEKGFKPVSLGQSTLRTETAGFAACHLINAVNKY